MKPALRRDLAAFSALVRRDLAARQHGNALLWARGLTIAASGTVALTIFATADPGMVSFVQRGGEAMLLILALGLVALVMSPAIAASSLRAERESGMLDLLLHAGFTPQALAFGRVATTLLAFVSLLGSALPALALFWFFRSLTPQALVLVSLAFAAWGAALSGLLVAVSAWARGMGLAVVATLLLLGAWIYVVASALDSLYAPWSALWLVQHAATRSFDAANWQLDLGFVEGLALHFTVGALGACIAARGLALRQGALRRDILAGILLGSVKRADSRWPLTWLLLRQNAAARPRAQILGLLVALIAMALASVPFLLRARSIPSLLAAWPGILASLGTLLAFAGLCGALTCAAQQAATLRAKGGWQELLATRRSAGALLADLLRASATASCVPFLAGLGLLVIAFLPQGLAVAGASAFLLLTGFLLSLVLGLFCSFCGSTPAISLTCALAAPTLMLTHVVLWMLAGNRTSGQGDVFDLMSLEAWQALLMAGLLMTALVTAFARRKPLPTLGGVLIALTICFLLFQSGGEPGVMVSTASGSLMLVDRILMALDTSWEVLPSSALVSAGIWQLVIAAALCAAFLSRAERMIGRPA